MPGCQFSWRISLFLLNKFLLCTGKLIGGSNFWSGKITCIYILRFPFLLQISLHISRFQRQHPSSPFSNNKTHNSRMLRHIVLKSTAWYSKAKWGAAQQRRLLHGVEGGALGCCNFDNSIFLKVARGSK